MDFSQAVCVCVCVPPWTKGLSPPLFPLYTGRGVWPSCPTTRNEAVDKKGKQGLIIPVYLLVSPQAVTPIFHFLIHGRLHDTSHKPIRPQQLRRRFACSRLCDNNVKPFKCSDPCTFLFSHLPSQRDLR